MACLDSIDFLNLSIETHLREVTHRLETCGQVTPSSVTHPWRRLRLFVIPQITLSSNTLSLLLAFHLAYVPMSSRVWKLELVSPIVLPGSRRFIPFLTHRHVNKEGGTIKVNINKYTWAKCVCIDFLCC